MLALRAYVVADAVLVAASRPRERPAERTARSGADAEHDLASHHIDDASRGINIEVRLLLNVEV